MADDGNLVAAKGPHRELAGILTEAEKEGQSKSTEVSFDTWSKII